MSKKKQRIKYDDLTQAVTVTISDMFDALHEAEHRQGITVRLRTATVAMFELSGIQRCDNGKYWLSIGQCLNNPRYSGGVYPPLEAGRFVDVGTTANAANGVAEALATKAQPVRGWRDMTLADLEVPYEEEA